ncbi:MAG: energy transducer TonB [Methylococcales bacterium]|nr:energy transducer TonB [Methylococcales bacterium]
MKHTIAIIASGLGISIALFWFMQFMISNNQQGLNKVASLQMTEFIRLKKDSNLNTKDRRIPKKPKPNKRPPPPKMKMQANPIKNLKPKMDMPDLDLPLELSHMGMKGVEIGVGNISTNVIPLVRIAPRYPMRAANRRIEGWVKVQFTITKEGKVADAVVVDSEPKNTFDRAALSAIKRWKFKAKIIEGMAFEQRAEQLLEFKLTK